MVPGSSWSMEVIPSAPSTGPAVALRAMAPWHEVGKVGVMGCSMHGTCNPGWVSEFSVPWGLSPASAQQLPQSPSKGADSSWLLPAHTMVWGPGQICDASHASCGHAKGTQWVGQRAPDALQRGADSWVPVLVMNVLNAACPAVPGLLIRARRGHVHPLQLFRTVFHPAEQRQGC